MTKGVHFWSSSKTRDKLKFYRLSDATFCDRIDTIYQFIKPFLDNKMSVIEEYWAFKTWPFKHIFVSKEPRLSANCRLFLMFTCHYTILSLFLCAPVMCSYFFPWIYLLLTIKTLNQNCIREIFVNYDFSEKIRLGISCECQVLFSLTNRKKKKLSVLLVSALWVNYNA